jgi:hypothetical protein
MNGVTRAKRRPAEMGGPTLGRRMHVPDAIERHAALCELGEDPHDHCECGLPMAPGADRCPMCREEGLDPIGRASGSDLHWDGKSYPSRRRRRLGNSDPDGYIALLSAIVRPPGAAGVSAGGDVDDG